MNLQYTQAMPLTLPKPARSLLSVLAVLTVVLAAAPPAQAESDTLQSRESSDEAAFAQWKDALRKEALGRGISQATLDKALTPAVPIPRIIELDRKQPEFTQTFWRYLDARVNDTRIARGREMLKTHAALLDKIWRKYHVPPRFLVAFWGL